jgi:hypothetical protein
LTVNNDFSGVAALCEVLRTARSLDPLRFWASQQYLQSISLAPAFAALAGRVELGQHGDVAALMQLAYEETWGLQSRNHGEAFKLFYTSMGGDVNELGTSPFQAETTLAAKTRLDIARGAGGESFHASLTAIAVANEEANLTIFAMLDRATRGETYVPVSRIYFDCHLVDEEAHRKLLSAIAVRNLPHDGEVVGIVVDRLLTVRDQFFGAVATALRKSGMADPL